MDKKIEKVVEELKEVLEFGFDVVDVDGDEVLVKVWEEGVGEFCFWIEYEGLLECDGGVDRLNSEGKKLGWL